MIWNKQKHTLIENLVEMSVIYSISMNLKCSLLKNKISISTTTTTTISELTPIYAR